VRTSTAGIARAAAADTRARNFNRWLADVERVLRHDGGEIKAALYR